MKKLALFLLLGAFLIAPHFVFAQDNTQATIQQLQAQIQALMAQLRVLQQQQALVPPVTAITSPATIPSIPPTEQPQNIPTFNRDLSFGKRGDDARDLQEFLTDQGYYAGPISGYYGLLTVQAVKKFQSANGINPTGYFGQRSRAIASAIFRKLVSQICSEEGCEGNVLPVAQLKIATDSDLHAVVSEYFSAVFNISGGSGNYLAHGDGYVPGLTFAVNEKVGGAMLYGNPTKSGVYSFVIFAKDVGIAPSTCAPEVTNCAIPPLPYGKERFTIIIKDKVSYGQPPVISGVKGPTTLKVGEEGIWTVEASDPNNGSLNYKVIWGDEVYGLEAAKELAPRAIPFKQAATFSHIYYRAGIYNPVFYIVNDRGMDAKTSISVNVGETIIKPSIQVLSPNGGERWTIGENQVIKWSTASPTISNVAIGLADFPISYSPTGLPEKFLLGTSVAASGSFNWVVGEKDVYGNKIAPGKYVIVVSDLANPKIYDQSDAPFSIVAAGNSVCEQLQTQITALQKQYDVLQCGLPTASNTDTCKQLQAQISALQSQLTTQCKTAQPSITVLSPNGGEQLTKGQYYTISWLGGSVSASDAPVVAINLWDPYTKTAVAHIKYCGEIKDYSRAWQWKVGYDADGKEIPNGNYRIYVYNCGDVGDASDAPFSIVAGDTAALTSTLKLSLGSYTPFAQGMNVTPGMEKVIFTDVVVSASGGDIVINSARVGTGSMNAARNLRNISIYDNIFAAPLGAISNLTQNWNMAEANFSWPEPILVKNGQTKTLRITADISPDAVNAFTALGLLDLSAKGYHGEKINLVGSLPIYGKTIVIVYSATQPSITVLSPNGGEMWQIGSTQTIKWSFVNIPNDARLSINLIGSNTTINIASYLELTAGGNFVWTIPNSLQKGDYKIEVVAYLMDSNRTFVAKDQSDAPFSIVSGINLPDLAVLAGFSISSPRYANQPVLITFQLVNQGAAAASPAVYIYSNQADGVSSIDTSNTCTGSTILQPGQSCFSAYKFTFSTAGVKNIEVKLDPSNLLQESNENNNLISTSIEVLNQTSSYYPGFFMVLNKSSYLPSETVYLTMSRADNRTDPYSIDLYSAKIGQESNMVLVQKAVAVSVNTGITVPLSQYSLFTTGGSGQYYLISCAAGCNINTDMQRNSTFFTLEQTVQNFNQ